MDRREAEHHWDFIYKVLMAFIIIAHLLYVEGMLHGAKHQKEEDNKSKEATIKE
jgi:hypothetical protein